jgi:hypothetical protein
MKPTAFFRSLCLVALATLIFTQIVPAQSKDQAHAAKMKAEIQKLGTGGSARVKLKLRDGTKVRGYVKEMKDNSFVVVNDQSGAATEIQYADASKEGKHLPLGAQVVIGIVIGFAVILGITYAVCQTHG